MGLTSLSSLQVCMDSSDWLQGTIPEDSGMDSSSSPSGDMLACSRPLMERRLRPQHDQPLKCPRCDSTHTKFCYYNNYSLSQPRYFCKTCRRYWTKGGTLRNIPVGGGCRKNKKASSKKPNNDPNQPISPSPTPGSSSSSTELQLSHLTGFMAHGALGTPNFMLDAHPRPIDFMETKYDTFAGGPRSAHDFLLGGDQMGVIGSGLDMGPGPAGMGLGFSPLCSPFGMSLDGGAGAGVFMDGCHRLMLPYDHDQANDDQNGLDVKPNTKLLSLEWQDQSCSDAGKESYGYINSMGSWPGLMNGYGSSTTNPLV